MWLQARSPLDQLQSSFVLVRGAHHSRLAQPSEFTNRIGISRWRVIVVVADKSEKRLRELDALGRLWRHSEQSLSSHFNALGCDSHSLLKNGRPVPFLQCRNDVIVKCHMMGTSSECRGDIDKFCPPNFLIWKFRGNVMGAPRSIFSMPHGELLCTVFISLAVVMAARKSH